MTAPPTPSDAVADGLPMNVLLRLSEVQRERRWLSDETLADLSRETGVPLYALGAVASFYPHYRRQPPPRCSISVCRDAACHMNGAPALLEATKAACASMPDVEVRAVSCLGRCEGAPAAAVDDAPVLHASAERLSYGAKLAPRDGEPEPLPTPDRRFQTDPYHGKPRYGVLRDLLRAGPQAFHSVPATLTAAGLQGMGGAGFPTGRKWDLVRAAPGTPKYVVCNADESEPCTFKDRVILQELSHLVLEGMLIACKVIGATTAVVYVRHEYGPETERLRRTIDGARTDGLLAEVGVDVVVFVSPGGYILGEETALLEALEGRRGEPRNKPPFPGTHGLHQKPTLMNNVETFAHVPRILSEGADAWKARGMNGAPGLKFMALAGDVERPGVYEVPMGFPARRLLEEHGGGVKGGRRLLAFCPGGASTSFLPADKIDAPLSFDGMRAAGSALGSGAMLVVAEGRDLLDLATNVVRFFRNESCGKCVPCRVGSEKAVEILERVARGDAGRDALSVLPALHETLALTSICGLGMVALVPAMSVLSGFPKEMDARLSRAGGA